jgi:hypothetical protein
MPIRVPRAGIPDTNFGRHYPTPVPDIVGSDVFGKVAEKAAGQIAGAARNVGEAMAKREALAAESEAQMRFLDYANDITAWEESTSPDPDKHTENYRKYSHERIEERMKGLEGKAGDSFLRKARQFEIERLRHAITKQAGAFKDRELTAQGLLEDAVVRNESRFDDEGLWSENGPWNRFEKEYNRRVGAGVKFPQGYLEKARDRLVTARLERLAQQQPNDQKGYSDLSQLYDDLKNDSHPYSGLMSPEARHKALERTNTELTRRETAIRGANAELRAQKAEDRDAMIGRFYSRINAVFNGREDPVTKRKETWADIEADMNREGTAERLGSSMNALQDQIEAYKSKGKDRTASTPPTPEEYVKKAKIQLEIAEGKWDGHAHELLTLPGIHPTHRDDIAGQMASRITQKANKAESQVTANFRRRANDLYRQLQGKTNPYLAADPELQAIAIQAQQEFLTQPDLKGPELEKWYHEVLGRHSKEIDEKVDPVKLRQMAPPGIKTPQDVINSNLPQRVKDYWYARMLHLEQVEKRQTDDKAATNAAAEKKKADEKAKAWSLENAWNAVFGGSGVPSTSGGRVAPSGPESRQTPGRPTSQFDVEGNSYDDSTARAAGMSRGADGHMGSVAEVPAAERKRLGLPDESYIVLKGRQHPTWDKAVEAEKARGFKIVKIEGRYYSVPQNYDAAQRKR